MQPTTVSTKLIYWDIVLEICICLLTTSTCKQRNNSEACTTDVCDFQSMASELNMYESQVNEYKYEIERIARELQEVKKKYFMQKKKEQTQKWVYFLWFYVLMFDLIAQRLLPGVVVQPLL